MLQHTSEKLYQCSQDDKSYSDITNVKGNKTVHTSEENGNCRFSCPECDYTSKQTYHLEKHMLSHKILICSECEYHCKGKGEMRQHKKIHLMHFSSSSKISATILKENSNSASHTLKNCNENNSKQFKVIDNEVDRKITGITPILKKRGISPSISETSSKKIQVDSSLDTDIVVDPSDVIQQSKAVNQMEQLQINDKDSTPNIDLDLEAQITNSDISCLERIELIRRINIDSQFKYATLILIYLKTAL